MDFKKTLFIDCRYWSRNNPRWIGAERTRETDTVMVWAGIIDEKVIGPYFFDHNVNGDTYLEMLQHYLLPELERLGINPLEIMYMHDGAPPHYSIQVRQFLNANFSGFIGPGNDAFIRWPARSPDLNILDFFFWAFVKHVINQIPAVDIDDLLFKIEESFDQVTQEMLNNCQNEILKRLRCCIRYNGAHIEQHLKYFDDELII